MQEEFEKYIEAWKYLDISLHTALRCLDVKDEKATSLHKIELDFIVNGEVTGARLEWAKENMPKLERPAVYFQPCIEWLEERGVKFKEEGMDR